MKYIRKIIEVETRLGFMSIPAKAKHLLPSKNCSLQVVCKNKTISNYELNYNVQYSRIFGLTTWYRANNITTNTFLDISIENGVVYVTMQNKNAHVANIEEETEELNISKLSSTAKGNIVEDRIKELILLQGLGELNVYKPVIDHEGIDLIVLRKGQFHPIFLQIKSRYNARKKNNLTLTLSQTFSAHHSYFIVGVSFNATKMEMEDKLLFISSKEVNNKAILLNEGKRRIVASMNENTNDQYKDFWVSKVTLVEKLIEKFDSLSEVLQ